MEESGAVRALRVPGGKAHNSCLAAAGVAPRRQLIGCCSRLGAMGTHSGDKAKSQGTNEVAR